VAGFFDGYDLVGTDSNSNRGELFYGIVPDPNGTVSCAHTVDALVASVPSTFLHELQHLISFSQHVLVHRGDSEAGWLDEGMSIVAEELGAVHYEQEFPPPTGRTNPAQLFPDSAEGFMTGVIEDSYAYLQRTDTSAVTLHSDADGGLTWRGGDWLLLRWLGDQFGSGFYRTLDQGSATGIANIEAASGTPFPTLFGSFSLALYTDSIPGVPRAAAPAADRFVSRNLRQLYQAYYRAAGPSPYVPTPFPFTPTPLTGSVTARLLPGSMAFYAVTASSAAPTLTLQFATPAGGALPSGLHPQLSVYRLQ
jgi:hypothetical protein